MNPNIQKEFSQQANIFKALAHPIRLFIVQAVNERTMSVKELTEIVGVDISTMSKHLDILKRNNIVTAEKVKNYVYYSLAVPCVLDFMSCATKVISKK